MKVHLVVDAIGSILAEASPEEFGRIFDDFKTTVHGVSHYPADFEDRKRCFSELK